MKRCFDLVASVLGLLLLSPVLLAVTAAIKLDSPGPVLYRGQRVGRFGRSFLIFKFRTMVVNAEQLGGSSTAGDDPRVTRVGRFLRKLKLDEFPQLMNVVLGDMSLVGPRPEVQQYVNLYTEEEQAILKLRPGITDWASLWNSDEGAALAGYPDPDQAYLEIIRPIKLKLQLRYLHEHSVWLDVRILVLTVLKIFWQDLVPRELAGYPKPWLRSREASLN